MTSDVLCIGESMLVVTPADGSSLRTGLEFAMGPGGAESNVAGCLAELGHDVAWASAVGTDPLGDRLVGEITRRGVDVSRVERRDAPTGVYFKDAAGAGGSVHYYRRGSAASSMSRAFVDDLTRVNPRLVHVSGITAALSASCREMLVHVLDARPFGPASVSFDVNYRPALWPVEDAGGLLLSLARAADIVFVGLDEAATLWRTETAEDVRTLIPEPNTLVVKDGAVAASEHSDGTTVSVPALHVEVVDPVGAGDAFAGGWLSGWLRGIPAEGRLRLGHAMASAALVSRHDHGIPPSLEQQESLLAMTREQWAMLDTSIDVVR